MFAAPPMPQPFYKCMIQYLRIYLMAILRLGQTWRNSHRVKNIEQLQWHYFYIVLIISLCENSDNNNIDAYQTAWMHDYLSNYCNKISNNYYNDIFISTKTVSIVLKIVTVLPESLSPKLCSPAEFILDCELLLDSIWVQIHASSHASLFISLRLCRTQQAVTVVSTLVMSPSFLFISNLQCPFSLPKAFSHTTWARLKQ